MGPVPIELWIEHMVWPTLLAAPNNVRGYRQQSTNIAVSPSVLLLCIQHVIPLSLKHAITANTSVLACQNGGFRYTPAKPSQAKPDRNESKLVAILAPAFREMEEERPGLQ